MSLRPTSGAPRGTSISDSGRRTQEDLKTSMSPAAAAITDFIASCFIDAFEIWAPVCQLDQAAYSGIECVKDTRPSLPLLARLALTDLDMAASELEAYNVALNFTQSWGSQSIICSSIRNCPFYFKVSQDYIKPRGLGMDLTFWASNPPQVLEVMAVLLKAAEDAIPAAVSQLHMQVQLYDYVDIKVQLHLSFAAGWNLLRPIRNLCMKTFFKDDKPRPPPSIWDVTDGFTHLADAPYQSCHPLLFSRFNIFGPQWLNESE